MINQMFGRRCGAPHPDLAERPVKVPKDPDVPETMTPVFCTARYHLVLGIETPHLGKHRARLGRHLIRWA